MRTLLDPFYGIPTIDIQDLLEDHQGDIQGAMREWAAMLRATADEILDVARIIKGKKVEIVTDTEEWTIALAGLDEKTEAELNQLHIVTIEGQPKEHRCPDCGNEM